MQHLQRLQPLCCQNGTAVALGFFDGLHLGHKAVVQGAIQHAKKHALCSAVFSFTLPPDAPFKKGRIVSGRQKRGQLQEWGVDCYIEPPFASFCGLSPQEFVVQVLHKQFAAKAVFCGENFTFGRAAAGNVALLKALCRPLGIEVCVVPMAQHGGAPISASRIRAALQQGEIQQANAMLGRPFCIDFAVQHGKKLGTSLGFPTINQQFPAGFVAPKYGVYLTKTKIRERWYPSATGFGTRPTVDENGAPSCETFLVGFSGDLYGSRPTVAFGRFFAEMQKYDSLQQLTAAVQTAAGAAQEYFAQQQGQA